MNSDQTRSFSIDREMCSFLFYSCLQENSFVALAISDADVYRYSSKTANNILCCLDYRLDQNKRYISIIITVFCNYI